MSGTPAPVEGSTPANARPADGAARLPDALMMLPVALLLLDADAMILHANDAAVQLLELPAGGGRRLMPFTRLTTQPPVFVELTRSLAGTLPAGGLRIGAVHLRSAAGRDVLADLRLQWHDAAARHILVAVIDRSGWADEEAGLRAQRCDLVAHARRAERLLTAAQLGDTMIALCDAQQRVEWVNAAFERGSGWSLDELRGMRLNVLHGPATSADAVAAMRLALSSGEGFSGQEVLNYRRDGQAYWAQVSVAAVRDAEGRIDGFVGAAQNIDARKRAQQALAEREGLLSGVFDAAPDAALVVRRDGAVAEANQCARRLLGLRGDAPLSDTPARAVFAPDDREAFDAAFERALFGNTHALDLVTRTGTVCSAKLWPLWRRAETQAVLVVLVDQTETRAAEARRRVVEATASANQLRSEFLSRVSHELRTPLNAILGFAQLLDAGSRADRADRVQHIMHAGRHLLALIDDVLDLSSAASGELRVSLADQPLAPLLDEVIALQTPSAERAQVTIECEGARHGVAVRADPVRLRQVLTNLVSNAIKYNVPGGRVIITTTALQAGRVEIAVADTGTGLTPQQQEGLFQPFNRLGAERRRIGGTGIGLVVTQSLVKAMGGQLEVASAAGRGSRFAFTLAAAPSRAAAATAAPAASPALPSMARPPGPPTWADGLPTTVAAALADLPARGVATAQDVLYIEDDPTNALLVEAALRPICGLRLRVAETIAEGLRSFGEHPPRLVLLDMHLPDGHGLQALDRLRRLPAWRCPRVIALSADADKRHIGDALAAGVDEYLTKPIVVSALLDSVRRALAAAPCPT